MSAHRSKIEKKVASFRHLRWACRGITFAAVATSVWGNILHATNGPVSVVLAMIAPIAALGGFELNSRIPLRDGAPWHIRYARPFAMSIIVGMAMYMSFWHQRDAFGKYTEAQSAVMLPIVIDALMMVAAICVGELNHHLERLEAALEANDLALARSEEQPARATNRRKASKKEQVIRILTKSPEMAPDAVAKKADVSVNYVYSIKQELNRQKLATVA